MRFLRIVLAAVLCAVVVLAIRRDVAARYQCSAEKKRAQAWMESARESASMDRRMSVARGLIPRLGECIAHDPADYEALFLLGVAQREAEQKEAALRSFTAALALNERPEIYTNLGILQLEAGRLDEARHNLRQAAFFSIDYTGQVDQAMATELYEAVEARHRRIKGK